MTVLEILGQIQFEWFKEVSALAVILFGFAFLLHWVLTHFTAQMSRMESAIHANTLALLTQSRTSLAISLTPESDAARKTLDEIDQSLARLQEVLHELANEK